MRERRSLRDKCQLKMIDDPVHHGIIYNKSDDLQESPDHIFADSLSLFPGFGPGCGPKILCGASP